MADYLCQISTFDLESQRLLFQFRSETNSIPANLGKTEPCQSISGEFLENPHTLISKKMNKPTSDTYEKLISGNIIEMKKALKAWKQFKKKLSLIQCFNIGNPILLFIMCCYS